MSRMCQVCGGLVPAPNEVLGYSGPICNGMHGQYPSVGDNYLVDKRLAELEKRVQELSQRLATTQKPAKRHSKNASVKPKP